MTDIGWTAEVLDIPTCIQRWGPDWCDLADQVEGSTIFQRPAAIQGWLTHYATDVTGSVIIVHAQGKLKAVLALMQGIVWRGPAFAPRIDYAAYDRDLTPKGRRFFPVRQVASVVSWRASTIKPQLLCQPQDMPIVCNLIAKKLCKLPNIDQIVLPIYDGPDIAHWADAFRNNGMQPFLHRLARQVYTYENLRSVEDIIAQQSSNFRKNTRRMFKRAAEANFVVTHLVGHAEVMARLHDFTDVADRSWKNLGRGDGTVAISHDATQKAYLLDLLNGDDPSVVPVLGLIEQDGVTIAASLWFRHSDTMSGLYVFRDDQDLPVSSGLLVVLEGYRKANDMGLGRIDLNSTQDWVRALANKQQSLVNIICFPNTMRGRIYRQIAKMRKLLKPL